MNNILKDFLNTIKYTFPPYLTLLIFYPFLLGIIIDPSLFNARHIAINLVWISVFTIPIIILKNKILYKIIAFLFFVLGFIETSHWLVLNGPITITSLLVISNTYMEEVKEFTSVIFSFKFLLITPYLFLFYKSLKKSGYITHIRVNKYIVLFFSVVSIIFILENAINGRLIRKGIPNIAKVSFSFIERIQLFKKALKNHKPRNLKGVNSLFEGKQTCVLILGESNNRRHMSLYGSENNTSPKLTKRNDIVIFKDVVSPWSTTIRTVLTILTQTNLEKEVSILKNIDILDIFHSAGFKNYWISNQCPVGVWDNQITEFSKKSESSQFVNMTSNSSYEATYTPSYDEKLITPFKKILNNNDDKKLIILHMLGNHLSYSKRYPNDFNIFKGDGTKISNTKAEYNNSLVYTDFIIDSIFNILNNHSSQDSNHIISSVYLSDHGENVYDVNNQIGHGYSKSVPKVNVEIPFIVWCSNTYKINYSKKYNQIIRNKNMPYVSDDLFHSLIDLNMIQTNYLDSTRSIFHREFNYKRKRILCDGNDYDLK